MNTLQTTIAPPVESLKVFTVSLFEPDDLVEIRLVHRKTSRSVQDFIAAQKLPEPEKSVRLAELNSSDSYDVYFGANPRARAGGKREDVLLARSVFVDIDNATHRDDAIERITVSGLPDPTLILSSGHGVHAYWRLSDPLRDLQEWTAAQKHLITLLDSDERIHDAPRVMRLPGFVNHKPPQAMCELLFHGGQRVSIGQILNVVGKGENADALLQEALARAVKGNRNSTAFWLACQLRDAGIAEGIARDTLQYFARKQEGDYTREEAMASLRSAFSAPPRPSSKSISMDQEPVLLPIEEANSLPEITPAVFGGWAGDYVSALCDATEVSPTFGTMLLLPALASACQRRFVVLIEPGYTEPLCLYSAPSLESGERKTAVHSPIFKPILQVQKELQDTAKDDMAEAKLRHEWAEKRARAMEKDMLEAHAAGDIPKTMMLQGEVIRMMKEAPEAKPLPQLVIEDFTEAALSVALANNGESLLVTSDEGGLFDNLGGRFNDRPEIDLFLKAHIGSPHTINRTGRENVFLNRPLLSVGISPQPGVLAKLGAIPGFADRGLLARFLWAFPSSMVGGRTLEPKPIAMGLTVTYFERLKAMARAGHGFEGDQPLDLTLSPDAHARWKSFQRELEPRMGADGDLRIIKPWASKLSGAVARIAAIAHLAEHAISATTPNRINLAHMEQSAALGQLLIPHALAAHRLMFGGSRKTAVAVVHHLNANGWPRGALGLSGWWRLVRKVVGDSSKAFEPVARVLADHGYLIEVARDQPIGRPGTNYRANQRLHKSE